MTPLRNFFAKLQEFVFASIFERRVLAVVRELDERGYAVLIADYLQARFGKSVSLGAIYAMLDRMGKKGLVTSWLGDPTFDRGGRRKRFYRIADLFK